MNKLELIFGECNQKSQVTKLITEKKNSEQIFGQFKQSQVTEWIGEEIWTNLWGMVLKRVKTQSESVNKSVWISGEQNEKFKSMNHGTNFVFPISSIVKELRHTKHTELF